MGQCFPSQTKKAVHLMGQNCPNCPIKVKNYVTNTVGCQHANLVISDIKIEQLAVQVIMAYVNVGQGLKRGIFSINFCRTKCLRTKLTKFQKRVFTIQSSLTEKVLIHDITNLEKKNI